MSRRHIERGEWWRGRETWVSSLARLGTGLLMKNKIPLLDRSYYRYRL